MAIYKDKKTGKTYNSPGRNRVQVDRSQGAAGKQKEINKKREPSKGFKASKSGKKTAGDIIRESRTDPNDPTTGSWARVKKLAEAESAKQKKPKFGSGGFDGSGAGGGWGARRLQPGESTEPTFGRDGTATFAESVKAGTTIETVTAALGVSSIQAIPGILTAGKTYITSALTKALGTTTGQAGTATTNIAQINANTVKISNNIIQGGLAKKGIVTAGSKVLTKVAAAAGLVFLGMWGQAESGEPLSIAMRDIAYEARKSGDWTLYNEAAEVRNEIITLEEWEKLAMWTPLAPLIGITNKIKGVKAGAIVQDKFAQSQQTAQANGETPQQTSQREAVEEQNDYKANIDYYNEQRKLQLQWEEEAADRDMKEDAAFWAKQRDEQAKKEKEDREAIAAFWSAYRKEQQKIAENNRPSNLNFGLI